MAFCAHSILGDDVLEVPDALEDERFHDNPLVTGAPGIRYYAGAPLTTPDGQNIGSLCVIDRTPRHLAPEQLEALALLGRQVVARLELGAAMRRLARQSAFHQAVLNSAGLAIISTTLEGVITSFNPSAERLLGYGADELIGRQSAGVFHDGAEVAARASELTRELKSSLPGIGSRSRSAIASSTTALTPAGMRLRLR